MAIRRNRVFSSLANKVDPNTGKLELTAFSPEISQSLSTDYVQYSYDGELSAQTGTAKLFAPDSYNVTGFIGRLSTAADADIELIINKNGTQVDTLTITSGQTSVSDSASFPLSAGDYLSVDINSVGTTNKGADLNITFTLE